MTFIDELKKKYSPMSEEELHKHQIVSYSTDIVKEVKHLIELCIRHPDRYPHKIDCYYGNYTYEGMGLHYGESKEPASILDREGNSLSKQVLEGICRGVQHELQILGLKNCSVTFKKGIDMDSRHQDLFGRFVYNKKGYTIHISGNF